MNIMTFREYKDFDRETTKEEYKRNVTYYDPCKGWVLDLQHKINIDDPINEDNNNDNINKRSKGT